MISFDLAALRGPCAAGSGQRRHLLSHTSRAVLGLMVCGGALCAQTGSGSDVSGLTAAAYSGGAFTPLADFVSGAGRTRQADSAVARTARELRGDRIQVSSATGLPIAPEALRAVAELLSSGSSAAIASFERDLASAGAPAVVHSVASRFATIGLTSDPRDRILAAARALNALVAQAPRDFLANPPSQFLALHFALQRLTLFVGGRS